MKSNKLLLVAATLLLAGATILAESPKGKDPANVEADVLIQAPPAFGVRGGVLAEGPMMFDRQLISGSPDGGTFSWVASEISMGGKPVTGVPYAAEAITETTQTLADGNRIQRKSTASVYRDSEGRTRREQTLSQIGPWANSGDAPQTIFINDPVARTNYILNPKDRTVRKLPSPVFISKAEPAGSAPAHAKIMRFERRIGPALGEAIAFSHVGVESSGEKPQTESLGKRVIEGVEAEGSRTTITIPAGQIGNELPIQIVSERWVSPELQAVVMSKHTDPRMGETIYRLAGISRSEQPRSLFEVPADYKVEEEGPNVQRLRMLKKLDGGN